MAYCLNPYCPHKKKTGNPAEFQEGITRCSDCGSVLKDMKPKKTDNKNSFPNVVLSDLSKKVFYTICLVLIWKISSHIAIPGISFNGIETTTNLLNLFGTQMQFSILALGIMPYVSAYIIVEILSLFVSPLKAWRKEGYLGRVKIKQVALYATVVLALLQSWMVALGMQKMMEAGENIVNHPGPGFLAMSAMTMTAGTFLTIGIAEIITKKGVGHGISIILLTGFANKIISLSSHINSLIHNNLILGESLMLFSLITILVIALIILMERSKRKIPVRFRDGTEAYIPLKLTSAGTEPAEWGSTVLALPIFLSSLISGPSLPKWLIPFATRGLIYYIAYFIVIVFLYYLFTALFYNSINIAAYLKKIRAFIVRPSVKKGEIYIDKSLEVMIPIGAMYLILMLFMPGLFSRFWKFFLGGISLITGVVIVLDLIEEFSLRLKRRPLVKIAELHDVAIAGLFKSLLEKKRIPCFLKGYYHRALLYFFGPYIEISVMVPEDKVTKAKEIVKTYLDAKVLIPSP